MLKNFKNHPQIHCYWCKLNLQATACNKNLVFLSITHCWSWVEALYFSSFHTNASLLPLIHLAGCYVEQWQICLPDELVACITKWHSATCSMSCISNTSCTWHILPACWETKVRTKAGALGSAFTCFSQQIRADKAGFVYCSSSKENKQDWVKKGFLLVTIWTEYTSDSLLSFKDWRGKLQKKY